MISAVVLTKNEEKNIERCLKSLAWADEILVIDDNSIDKTTEIAIKYGAKILTHELENDFSKQRNFGQKNTKGDWVLFIDADEEVTPGLKREIIDAVNNKECDGFYLNRQDIFFGKKMKGGEWGNMKIVRLAKRAKGEWVRPVHERWNIKGKIGTLRSPLLHYSHNDISELIASLDIYSSLHADTHQAEHVKSNIFKIIFFPAFKFVDNFIIKRGYKDGIYGFIFSIMISFHSFMGWSKLYTENSKKG